MTDQSPMLKVLPHTDPALTSVCGPAPTGTDLIRLVSRMIAAMNYPAGIGLAAPQIGELARVIVVRVPSGHDSIGYAIANPEIYWTGGGTKQDWEGCLSFPKGYRALVPRHNKIKIRGVDMYGKPLQFGASKIIARVIQHEVDHLDGVLITDNATRIDERKPDGDI